jgi:hypothetical protein
VDNSKAGKRRQMEIGRLVLMAAETKNSLAADKDVN